MVLKVLLKDLEAATLYVKHILKLCILFFLNQKSNVYFYFEIMGTLW